VLKRFANGRRMISLLFDWFVSLRLVASAIKSAPATIRGRLLYFGGFVIIQAQRTGQQ
jgi:hypothetical protein